ncbi:MAG: hypothetical protein ABJM29_14185 [Rhizobiaceae bacterium]
MRSSIVHYLIALSLLSGCKAGTSDQQLTGSIKGDENSLAAKLTPAESDESDVQPSLEDSLTLVKEPFAESYVPPKRGTVYTYHNNWASLPKVIKYKVSGVEKIGRRKYLKFTSVGGLKNPVHAYYDLKNFNLKGYRDLSGKAVVSFRPAEQRYRFPLKPGDKWLTKWQSKDHKKNEVTSGGGIVRVERIEQLALPIGVYKTVRVRLPLPRNAPRGMTHHLWFSPKLGVTVKEQIKSTNMNWTQILAKVEGPTG